MKTITAPVLAACLAGSAFLTIAAGRAGGAPVADRVAPRFVPPAPADQALAESGPLGARLHANLVGRLLMVDEAGLLDGFRHRPGKQEWIGEHAGKFLDAAARVYAQTRDARLGVLMKRMTAALIATQKDDGYLGTYTDEQRWTSWDVWAHKYDLMGLLQVHAVTGDAAALAAARKIGDLLARTFGDGPGQRDIVPAGTHVGMAATSVLGPVVSLYKATGDAKYLAFARYLTRAIEQPNGPRILSTLRATGSVSKTANGKAYEMLSNLNGLVDLYALTGERAWLEPALAAWADIAARRLYVTGTTSAGEHFQDDAVLPGEKRDNIGETCVTVNWLELSQRLFRLTGEAKYADEIERTIFNHLLAAQDGTNGDFCYYTPLHGEKPYGNKINCCLSSGPRGLSIVPELPWGRLDRGVAVLLYAPGKMKAALPGGPVVSLVSETRFPADGAVTLTVSPSRRASFPLYLRVPAWATRFRAEVGGVAFDGAAGALLTIDRAWKAGDRVRVEMDLPVRVLPGGKSYPDRVAVQRGPQILAADAKLAPDVPRLDLLALSLTGGAVALSPGDKPPAGHTAVQVYRAKGVAAAAPGTSAAVKPVDVTLVPYADARAPRVFFLRPETLDAAIAAHAARLAQRPVADAARVAAPPKVDGALDEKAWRLDTKVALPVRGAPRNTVTFGALWDAENLYLGVRVLDPKLENIRHTTEDFHNNDKIEIGLEPGDPRLPRPLVLTKAWNKDALGGPVLPGVQHAWAAIPGGFTVEMAIPWKSVAIGASPGQIVALDICNTDAVPPPGKRNKLQWSSAKEGLDADTEGYGRLRLVAARQP